MLISIHILFVFSMMHTLAIKQSGVSHNILLNAKETLASLFITANQIFIY